MTYVPFNRGPSPVGARTIELRDFAGAKLVTEVWYPAAERHRGDDLADATRDTFAIASGLPSARQSAVRNAEPLRAPLPLVMYWHGGYGHRREASYLCTHLASHGYAVAAPDFPGDHISHSLAPAAGAKARVSSTPIDESARNRPRQAVAAIDGLLAAASSLGLAVRREDIGSCGISMGGFTTLAVNSLDARIAASFAICPMWGARGPVPQVRRLQALLSLDDWQRGVSTFVLTGELDPLVVLPDVRELYTKLHAPKRLAVLKRAGHMHFGDGAETGHETYRRAYLSGSFPDPEIDAIALGTAMRPFAELCSEADSLATARALCLAHMDATLRMHAGAREFLDGNLEHTFATRGIALEA
jgi:dienelactone hydrolase